MDDTSTTSTESTGGSSAAVADAPASTSPASSEPQATTDRPSFGQALDAFNEVQKQKGKRTFGKAPAELVAAVDTPADPTAAPAQAAPTKQPGPVPWPVHEKALESVRKKAEGDVRGLYGGWTPEQAREARTWYERAATDRVGFLGEVINEALQDPQLGPQVLSLAGRALGTRQAAPTAVSGHEPPGADFEDPRTGKKFYSAETLEAREQWLAEKVKADILQQLDPSLQEVNAIKSEREQERQRTELGRVMGGHLSEARSWPQFKEHEAEIKQALLNAPLTSGHPAEEAILLRRVYEQVVGPKLKTLQQQEWLAELKRNANVSSVNPAASGAPSGVPTKARAKTGGTMGEALKWAASMQSGRG